MKISILLFLLTLNSAYSITMVNEGDPIRAAKINEVIDQVNSIETIVGPTGPQGPAGPGVEMAGAIKAWVRFNGSNATIAAQGNVSSVVRNGLGNYTITFTTAMPDANYAIFGSARRSGYPQVGIVGPRDGGIYSATQIQINVNDDGGTPIDSPIINVMVLR